MLKVILLDIDNTLLSFDEYVKESMKSGFEKFHLGTYEDKMFPVFLEINTKLWQEIEQGALDFAGLQKIRWNLIFDRLGIAADGLRFEAYFRDCLFESTIPEEGALELVRYLSGRYLLCAASNGPYHQQVNRLKIAGMLPYFSDIYVSEEIGHSKPSAQFFLSCIDRLQTRMTEKITSDENMIIGDSLSSDMAGGIGVGMKTCFYNPTQKPLPPDMRIDHVVTTLREITEIL